MDLIFVLGAFLVVAGALFSILALFLNKIDNKKSWTIFGVALITGIYVTSGSRITEVTTAVGTIKIAAEDAKNKAKEIEEVAKDINNLKIEFTKSIKTNLSEINKSKNESELLMKIMILEEKIKRKKAIIEVNNDPKYKDQFDPKIQEENQKMLDQFEQEMSDLKGKLQAIKSQ